MSRSWMCCALLLACGLVAGQAGLAVSVAADPPAKLAAPAESNEAAIERALSLPCSLEFVETPLGDVIEVLKNQHHIEIQLDKTNLDAAGVNSDTPITINVKGIKLESALNLILKPVQLDWVIRDEVLLITSEETARSELTTKLYPIRDLIQPAGDAAASKVSATDADSLINLITTVVQPATWSANGGAASVAVASGLDLLVVSQTRQGHAELSSWLAKLRQARDAQDSATRGKTAEVKDDKTPYVHVYPLPASAIDSPAQGLVAAVLNTIEPKTWEAAGGGGTIHVVGRTVVVRQTAGVHRQVQQLIKAIAKADESSGYSSAHQGFNGIF